MSWTTITGTGHSLIRSMVFMELLRGVNTRRQILNGSAYSWSYGDITPSGTGDNALVGVDSASKGARTWITWMLEQCVNALNGLIASGYGIARYKTDVTYATNYTSQISIGALDYENPQDWRDIITLIRAKIDDLKYVEFVQPASGFKSDGDGGDAQINRTSWTPAYSFIIEGVSSDSGFYIAQNATLQYGGNDWEWSVYNDINAWRFLKAWPSVSPKPSLAQAHLINVDFRVAFTRADFWGRVPPDGPGAPPADWGTFTRRLASISSSKYSSLSIDTDISGDTILASKSSSGMGDGSSYTFPSTIDIKSLMGWSSLPSSNLYVAIKTSENVTCTTEEFCNGYTGWYSEDTGCLVAFSTIENGSSQVPGSLRLRGQHTYSP